jgi:hypothetical protein
LEEITDAKASGDRRPLTLSDLIMHTVSLVSGFCHATEYPTVSFGDEMGKVERFFRVLSCLSSKDPLVSGETLLADRKTLPGPIDGGRRDCPQGLVFEDLVFP